MAVPVDTEVVTTVALAVEALIQCILNRRRVEGRPGTPSPSEGVAPGPERVGVTAAPEEAEQGEETRSLAHRQSIRTQCPLTRLVMVLIIQARAVPCLLTLHLLAVVGGVPDRSAPFSAVLRPVKPVQRVVVVPVPIPGMCLRDRLTQNRGHRFRRMPSSSLLLPLDFFTHYFFTHYFLVLNEFPFNYFLLFVR